jgi:tricorn protease
MQPPVAIASTRIFEGENEEDIYRSPLKEIGVKYQCGDYVLALMARVEGNDDIYRLLRNKADNPVSLTVNSKPTMEGSRIVSYRPITDESNLIYLDWITRTANASKKRPTGASATFTFPTWARTAFANSSSGITRK